MTGTILTATHPARPRGVVVEQMKKSRRLSPNADPEKLYDTLAGLQVPCPWGNLQVEEQVEDTPSIPYAPIMLEIGFGKNWERSDHRLEVAGVREIGCMVISDIFEPDPHTPLHYVQLNLRNFGSINLFGFRVHAIVSLNVFTYDGFGVEFANFEEENRAARLLNNLLMPGGIIVNSNLGLSERFEQILQERFGFSLISEGTGLEIYPVYKLQKPFVAPASSSF